MDDFKRARPREGFCKCCMPKRLKPKEGRIARRKLKQELKNER